MVASGVPNENDGRHIIEIAECSLDIREVLGRLSHLLNAEIGQT